MDSYVELIERYERKTGKHLGSLMRRPNGTVIFIEPPNSSKDVIFIEYDTPPWQKELFKTIKETD